MTEYEYISFSQCCSVLKKYFFYIITFKKLDLTEFVIVLEKNRINYKTINFNEEYFTNTERYSELLVSVRFYMQFVSYKYILIHQLDCFVFQDDIKRWIDAEYSYIGAPWLQGYDSAQYGSEVIGVGNGGFSLRCVFDHLRVLFSFSRIKKKEFLADSKGLRCPAFLRDNTFFLFNTFHANEDIFWGDIAGINFTWFKIPDWKIAVQFSMEVQPEYFFKLNNNTLPFGCHAWWRYDVDFWKPHIEKFGYTL